MAIYEEKGALRSPKKKYKLAVRDGKVMRGNKVAVLISVGYGSGFWSWNDNCPKDIVFHPELVNLVLDGRQEEITKELMSRLLGGNNRFYLSSTKGLTVEWVEKGKNFRIEEYDGFERVVLLDDDVIFVA